MFYIFLHIPLWKQFGYLPFLLFFLKIKSIHRVLFTKYFIITY